MSRAWAPASASPCSTRAAERASATVFWRQKAPLSGFPRFRIMKQLGKGQLFVVDSNRAKSHRGIQGSRDAGMTREGLFCVGTISLLNNFRILRFSIFLVPFGQNL